MTTHKIDPQLVRAGLGLEYEIDMHFDEDLGIIEYGRTDDCHDGTSINIHEFKDKAIEYLAGKGWDMIIYPNEIAVMLPMTDPKSEGRPRMIFRIAEGFYPDKLSAELAAISFAWEQIQEKKDEN